MVIYGLPAAEFSWQQLQYRWPNKPSPGQLETHMRGTLQEIGLYRQTCLFWYKAECTPSRKMYLRSVGGLTGLVAARNGGPEKFDDMEDLAAAANLVVLNVLNDINLLPFNIITTNFVSDQVGQAYQPQFIQTPFHSHRLSLTTTRRRRRRRKPCCHKETARCSVFLTSPLLFTLTA